MFPLDDWLEKEIPIAPHLGAFGAKRKHHWHEGIDLYTNPGAVVKAVEPGEVVSVGDFTGGEMSPWWNDTKYVMVEGSSGVILYGEIEPALIIGSKINSGDIIGHVKTVLKKDKGRQMTMLHFELYEHGIREPVEWLPNTLRPKGLLNPTELLKWMLTKD